jgi:hypothetical protein
LSKGHTKELIPTGKGANAFITIIAIHTPFKMMSGKEIHQLCKNGLTLIHGSLLGRRIMPTPGRSRARFKKFKSITTLFSDILFGINQLQSKL